MALTAQQELFCKEVVACKFNGTEAYKRAYPKAAPSSAQPAASRLLSNVMVQQRIAEIVASAGSATGATPQSVIRELALIAFQRNRPMFREDGSLKPPSEWDESTDATISAVEVEEELVPDLDAEPEQAREPQAHGGELKRSKAKVKLVRTVKVKRWDKLKALELLSKHFGLLKEDAPHPDRPKIDTSGFTAEEKLALLAGLRRATGVTGS